MVSFSQMSITLFLCMLDAVSGAPWGDLIGDMPARNGQQNIVQCEVPNTLPSMDLLWAFRFPWHQPYSTIEYLPSSPTTDRIYQVVRAHFRGANQEIHRQIDMTYWQDTQLMYINYKWAEGKISSKLPQVYIILTWLDKDLKNPVDKMIIHLPATGGKTPVEYDCKTGIELKQGHAHFEVELYIEPM